MNVTSLTSPVIDRYSALRFNINSANAFHITKPVVFSSQPRKPLKEHAGNAILAIAPVSNILGWLFTSISMLIPGESTVSMKPVEPNPKKIEAPLNPKEIQSERKKILQSFKTALETLGYRVFIPLGLSTINLNAWAFSYRNKQPIGIAGNSLCILSSVALACDPTSLVARGAYMAGLGMFFKACGNTIKPRDKAAPKLTTIQSIFTPSKKVYNISAGLLWAGGTLLFVAEGPETAVAALGAKLIGTGAIAGDLAYMAVGAQSLKSKMRTKADQSRRALLIGMPSLAIGNMLVNHMSGLTFNSLGFASLSWFFKHNKSIEEDKEKSD